MRLRATAAGVLSVFCLLAARARPGANPDGGRRCSGPQLPPPASRRSPAPASPARRQPPAAAAPRPARRADSGGYTVRLRHLERSVSELKEQVFRTKARLQLLKETVLGGVIGASQALIKHRNEMGASFRLVKVVYALDGVQIFSKADESGQLGEIQEFEIYNGAIQPGSHTLSVQLLYQGHGFGVFSYLKGYKFNVRSSHTFVAARAGHGRGGRRVTKRAAPPPTWRTSRPSTSGSTTSPAKTPTAGGQK